MGKKNNTGITNFTNNMQTVFTGHDNVHIADVTPIDVTPDISFQFTDNQFEES